MLSPSGFRVQEVSLTFAGVVAALSFFGLILLVLTDWMRRKEAIMKQAFVLGVRWVMKMFLTIYTGYVATALPG